MIKATFKVRSYNAFPASNDIFQHEAFVLPMHRGSLITLAKQGDGWEIAHDAKRYHSVQFGNCVWEYIKESYNYDFNELTFILNHKILPEAPSQDALLECMEKDLAIDFSKYNLLIYNRSGGGDYTGLPVAKLTRVHSHVEIDDYYAEQYARSLQYGATNSGVFVGYRDPAGYVYWYKRPFTFALRVTIVEYLKERRVLVGQTSTGEKVQIFLAYWDKDREAVNTGKVDHLIGQTRIVHCQRWLSTPTVRDDESLFVRSAYNSTLYEDVAERDWHALLHDVVDVDTALSDGALLFYPL